MEGVITNYTPVIYRPTLFQFTDISNPERNFKTKAASSDIKYNFE